jgi:hypothetical protein
MSTEKKKRRRDELEKRDVKGRKVSQVFCGRRIVPR